MLQGLPSYQTEAMPTWGLLRSSSERPVASNIACDAPCTAGWVMRPEYLFSTDFVPPDLAGALVVVMALPFSRLSRFRCPGDRCLPLVRAAGRSIRSVLPSPAGGARSAAR